MGEEVLLNHVALQCLNKEEAEIFFTKILGIPKVRNFTISEGLSESIFGINKRVEVEVYDNGKIRFEVFIDQINRTPGYEHICIELEDKKEFSINTERLLKYFPETRNTIHLKECLKVLTTTLVEYNIFNKDRQIWGCFTLLSGGEIKEGECTYRYDAKLQERLNNPKIYAKINLLIQSHFKSKYSQIPWKNIIGMRDILAHQYFRIDLDLIWLTVTKKLPSLKETVEEMLLSLSDKPENC